MGRRQSHSLRSHFRKRLERSCCCWVWSQPLFWGEGAKCDEVECIGNFEEWLLVLSIVASSVVRHYEGRVGIESLLVE